MPKTVKSYLKTCLTIAYADRDELKGVGKLTEDEYLTLGNIRASIQNELGDNHRLLEKYGLEYNSNKQLP